MEQLNMANDIKRLNYFTGQFLEAQDFKDEQRYHIEMRRQLNRLLYSPGVIDNGFLVTKIGDKRISIGVGFAIDAQGRELFNTTLQERDISGFDPNAVVYVVFSYNEVETDNRSVDNISGFIRITENPDIKFLAKPLSGDQNEMDILIAILQLDNGSNIQNVDISVRQLANVKVVGKLGIGTSDPAGNLLRVNNGAIRFDLGSDKKLSLGGNGSFEIDKPYLTGGRFIITDGGNVGIGIPNPGAKLEIAIANDDNNSKPLTISKDTTNYLTILNNANVGIGTASPRSKLEITVTNDDANTKPLEIGKGTTSYLTILNNGNVGIGKPRPESTLDVNGEMRARFFRVGQGFSKRLPVGKTRVGTPTVTGDGGITTIWDEDIKWYRVAKISAPPSVPAGAEFSLRATVAGNTSHALTFRVVGFSGVSRLTKRPNARFTVLNNTGSLVFTKARVVSATVGNSNEAYLEIMTRQSSEGETYVEFSIYDNLNVPSWQSIEWEEQPTAVSNTFLVSEYSLDRLFSVADGIDRLTVDTNGNVQISGSSVLEFGAFKSKEASAGKIGYQTFTTDALDIVGAGATVADRKIKLYAEGGVTLTGKLTLAEGIAIKKFSNDNSLSGNSDETIPTEKAIKNYIDAQIEKVVARLESHKHNFNYTRYYSLEHYAGRDNGTTEKPNP
jgi:hypothetical protein